MTRSYASLDSDSEELGVVHVFLSLLVLVKLIFVQRIC